MYLLTLIIYREFTSDRFVQEEKLRVMRYHLLLLAAFLLTYCAPQPEALRQERAVNGSFSLNKAHDEQNWWVGLDGEWFYAYGVLEAPGPATERMKPETFPFLWTEGTETLAPEQAEGSATYKLRLTGANRLEKLGLDLPDVYTSFVLYADSVEVARNGTVGENPVAQWLPVTVKLPAFQDSLWLTLHVSNQVHSKGGVRISIVAGNIDWLLWKRDVRLALDWLLAGSLLLSGIFMLGLYGYSRQDKAMLYFGLMSVTWSYRVVGYGAYALNTVLPSMPWTVGVHLEYLTLFMTTVWFALYVYALFPEQTSKKFLYGLVGVSALFSVIVIVTPPMFFSNLVTPFFYILIPSLGYGVLVYVRAARDRRAGAKLSLLATGVLFVLFCYNILAYFGVFPERATLSFVAYFVFFVIQSVILGVRYAESLKRTVAEMKALSETRGRFLAQMSHELRTPLNAIIGYAQVLASDNDLGPRPKKHLNILQSSAHHLLSMINEILDFSRLDDGDFQLNRTSFKLADLAADLEGMFQLQARQKGLAFSVTMEPAKTVQLRADEVRVRQVLINLIGNAVKFTGSGSVDVKLSLAQDQTGSWILEGEVKDTGPGIPEADRATIFEPFRQVAGRFSQGTGLGLAITSRLLKLMEGSVELNSTVGSGSVFRIRVPVELLELAETPEAELADTGPPFIQPGARVLIVDDIAANATMLEALLGMAGLKTTVVSSAKEARTVFEPGVFNLALFDINMPEESGIQLLESLRTKYKPEQLPPVMALTADITHTEEDLRRIGFAGVMYKPFDHAQFLRVIQNLMGGSAGTLLAVDPAAPPQWAERVLQLKAPLSGEIVDALSIADSGQLQKLIPAVTDRELSVELERALSEKDFQFMLEVGQAAEMIRDRRGA